MSHLGFARKSAAIALGLGTFVLYSKAETVPSFDLERWQTGERVRLEDFAGQILVLDFFAYWCAPCERASKELETGVQQFYAARHGNARGVPVRVISVNVEKDFPQRTVEFLRKTGASFVVNEFLGTLLEQLGGVGIPFLAVVDGSRSKPGATRFEVVYKHSGFEGTRKLRQIIDGLGMASQAESALAGKGSAASGDGAPLVHTVEADSEFVWAADIFLTDTSLNYRQEIGETQWEATFGYGTFDMDYRGNSDFDPFTFPEHLDKERLSGRLDARQQLTDTVALLGSSGLYFGYPDYRRVWIANRYRQKYAPRGFPRVPPYEKPDPRGYNFSAGARWEYILSLAFAELHVGYAHDNTAPGYEDGTNSIGDYRLIKGRERLDTASVRLSSENVLTKRIRMLNEFTFAFVTSREVRFSYQGSLNVALGERWVVRGYGGITTEAPLFDAQFFGLTIECEVLRNLLFSLTGRYYKDTGEVFDPTLLSDAAPPLESWEMGAGLRYAWANSSFKLYVAPFWTDYTRKGVGFEPFRHLYADRNWGLAQIAYSLQF